jgi:NADPH:quinone reductase-like Zn-dependent oxidoreductase
VSGRDPRAEAAAYHAGTLKAIVRDDYGSPDVLELRDIDKPVAKDAEVLVRVCAAGVNMADVDYLLGRPPFARLMTGLRGPRNRVLGLDVAGVVEAVGTKVTKFQPGDEVFGDLSEYGYGGFAEYACAREGAWARKPVNLDFEEAATVPQAGVMALQGLGGRKSIQVGDQVLINGAGGNVGPFAVQIAKALGAEVTGVDRADKLEMLRSIGVDHVIDYATDDVVEAEQRYDRVLDVAAFHSMFEWKRVLRPGGVYVAVPNTVSGLFLTGLVGPLVSIAGSRKMGIQTGQLFAADDVAFLTELIEAGSVKPVIDRRYTLSEVPEALRYQMAGLPKGKLVITV